AERRRQMKRLVVVAFALALALVAHAAERPTVKPPTSVPRPERRDLKLDNGLAVTLIPFGDVPKVTVRVTFRAGNVDDPDKHVWLADVTGEMLQLGSEKLDAGAMARTVAGWGGQIDVNVTPDRTSIQGTVLSENAPSLIALIGDLVKHPRFPAS